MSLFTLDLWEKGDFIVESNLEIIHVMHQNDHTSLVLFECIFNLSKIYMVWLHVYTNKDVPFAKLYNALTETALEDLDIEVLGLVDQFPVCPCGRMGIACNYFCRLGYEHTALVDGKGGYIPPLFLGLKDEAAYLYPVVSVSKFYYLLGQDIITLAHVVACRYIAELLALRLSNAHNTFAWSLLKHTPNNHGMTV